MRSERIHITKLCFYSYITILEIRCSLTSVFCIQLEMIFTSKLVHSPIHATYIVWTSRGLFPG